MARIEIPLSEYKSLKERIKTLESSLVEASKETSVCKEKMETLESLVKDLEKEGLINRMFGWKKIVEPFKDILT